MAKILYLHQYFKTPNEPGASRSFFVGKALVEQGHEVLLLSLGNGHDQHISNGFTVKTLSVPYKNELGVILRLKAFIQYYFWARKIALEWNADIIYATSTPLTVGWLGKIIAGKKKIPLVFEVRDLWPDFPIQAGVLPFPLSYFSKIIERLIYQSSMKIVALSPDMVYELRKRTAPGKIVLSTNFSPFPPTAPTSSYKNFLYFGSLGRFNGIELWSTFFDQWVECNYQGMFYIMGNGAQQILIDRYVRKYPFIIQVPEIPRNEIPQFIQENRIGYSWITFSQLPVLGTNSPNKLFDSWQWGMVPIVNQYGWMKQEIEQGSGLFWNGSNGLEILQKIQEWTQNSTDFDKIKIEIQSIQRKYSAENSLQKIVELFRNQWDVTKTWAIVSSVHQPYDQRLFYRVVHQISNTYSVKILGPQNGLPSMNRWWMRMLVHYPVIFIWYLKHRPYGIHWSDPELLPLARFLQKFGVKSVWDVHEDLDEQNKMKNRSADYFFKFINHWEQKVMEKSKIIVAESYYSQKERYKNVDTHYWPNFPLDSYFEPLKSFFNRESEHPKFIYVGVINEFRGMTKLINAWEKVCNKYPHAELVLMGKSSVTLPYWVKHIEGSWEQHVDQLAGAWAAISFLIKPDKSSDYPFQSFPTKIGEYLALGIPVFCTQSQAQNEWIDESCGVVLNELEEDSCSQKMIQFIENEDWRMKLKIGAGIRYHIMKKLAEELSEIDELYS